MFLGSVIDVATIRPTIEVAEVFRLYFDDYLKLYHCTPEEFAAADAIMRCRTAALGGHLRACDHCGRLQIAYNSCNNRAAVACTALSRGVYGGPPGQSIGVCESPRDL
jgi:hypothetical protein